MKALLFTYLGYAKQMFFCFFLSEFSLNLAENRMTNACKILKLHSSNTKQN